jgi:hypothetical protein
VAVLALFWLLRPKGVPAREIVGLVPDVLRLLRSLIGDNSVPADVRLVLVGLVAWILRDRPHSGVHPGAGPA